MRRYAEVRVTGAAITVTPKDASGRLVREETGRRLRPVQVPGPLSTVRASP